MSTVFRRSDYQRWLRNCILSKFVVRKQNYCSVKTVSLDSSETIEDLKYYADFKKFIKATNIEFNDGHTCLQVSCKLCKNTSPDDKWAYVNKRTGSFNCPSCDVRVSLLQAKNAYEKSKYIVDHNKETAKVYKTKCRHLVTVPENICESLQIKGLKLVDFEMLNSCYDSELNILQFPLKNASNRIVGEKWLYLEDGREECFQNENLSGVLIYGTANKQKAIVVANLLDFLVLIAQRIDTRNLYNLI